MPDIVSAEQYIRENADFYTDTFFNPVWTSARFASFSHRLAAANTTNKSNIRLAKQNLTTQDMRPFGIRRKLARENKRCIPTQNTIRGHDITSWRTTIPSPVIAFVTTVQGASTTKGLPLNSDQDQKCNSSAKRSNPHTTGDPLPWPPVYPHSTSSRSQKSSSSSSNSYRPLTPRDFTQQPSHDVSGHENVAPPVHPFASSLGFERDVKTLDRVLFNEARLRGKSVPFEVLLDTEDLTYQTIEQHRRVDVSRRFGPSRTVSSDYQGENGPSRDGAADAEKTKGASLRTRLGGKVPPPLDLTLIEHSVVKTVRAINGSDEAYIHQGLRDGVEESRRIDTCADGLRQPDVAELAALP